jgi:hypothetical protein
MAGRESTRRTVLAGLGPCVDALYGHVCVDIKTGVSCPNGAAIGSLRATRTKPGSGGTWHVATGFKRTLASAWTGLLKHDGNMVLSLELFRDDKGGDTQQIRASEKARFAAQDHVSRVVELDTRWRTRMCFV